MEQLPNNPYTESWFRERAYNSLKQIDTTHWDYSDSLLMYLPGAEEGYKDIQRTENPYHQLVTKPERDYLQSIAMSVVEKLPEKFDYIDLGPGSEHKEQFIFDAAKVQNKKFIYIPVDINDKFLTLAQRHATDNGIPTRGIRTSFEEIVHKLGPNTTPRFVSLGLTYTNYAPPEILGLLKNIASREGNVFINTQVRDRVDMQKLVQIYSQEGYFISESKLKLLGLSREDVEVHTDEGIRVWATLKNTTPQLAQKGVEPGMTLLIFQSLRNTKEIFDSQISTVTENYTLLDTGATFLGALLRIG